MKLLSNVSFILAAGVGAVMVLNAFSIREALPHDAATGWSYPFSCCSNFDCRMVDKAAVAERPEGYVIANTGEVVGYQDKRIKQSPDGEYHWSRLRAPMTAGPFAYSSRRGATDEPHSKRIHHRRLPSDLVRLP